MDGAVLRVRIPGGRVAGSALRALGAASSAYADGGVHLTSRANLQLRGVHTDPDGSVAVGVIDALSDAALLPHPTHERVRNILCSPLTGLRGGLADVRPLVDELDAALCAAPGLADLPGPFLFVLDDGSDDVGIARADLGVVAVDGLGVRIWAGGLPGPVVRAGSAVPMLIELAHRFCRLVADAGRPVWHVRELPAGGTDLLSGTTTSGAPGPSGSAPSVRQAPLGALAQDDGRTTVSLLAPLGRLTRPQVTTLADAAPLGNGALIVTPSRGVLVPDLTHDAAGVVLDAASRVGLIVDDGSPWRGVTACPGSPRCERGSGDTEAIAGRVAATSGREALLPVHIVACRRACGRPAGRHAIVVLDRSRAEIRCGDTTAETDLDDVADVVVGLRLAGSPTG